MIEKLLENWLDSASERSYQAVFVQMLSAQGYRVVHSTRHTALEYGKDVLAIAPDGNGCAYQLKGHPAGRLGLEQFRRDIQPQLLQLISQAVVFPGFPTMPHRVYLVSNGYFEEEVQRAVDDMNRMPYPSKVTLISRGELLSWCKDFGASLWPSELDDAQAILELFLSDPRDVLPVEKLAHLISKVLALEKIDEKIHGLPQFHRSITSAALLTGIATSRFAEVENHFAVASAWTIFAVSLIASGEKHGLKLTEKAVEILHLAEEAAGDALSQLWNEVRGRVHLVEGNPISDPDVYGWRSTTLIGLLSCLALFDDATRCMSEEARRSLQEWLLQSRRVIKLWGEGAVASLVPWLVWLRKHDATLRPDFEIAGLTETVIVRNQHKSKIPLAGPYYSFEEIARFHMRLDKSGEASALQRETLVGCVFTAESLLHLLVRSNLKQKCKILWPGFTKLAHRACLPDKKWEYCTVHIKEGVDVTKIYPSYYTWAELQAEAIRCMDAFIPAELFARPWLLALWWQVVPYRYTTAASHVFVEGIMPGWGT